MQDASFAIDGEDVPGAYSSHRDAERRLTLIDDGSYMLSLSASREDVGEWSFSQYFGTNSILLVPTDQQSPEGYDIRRRVDRRITIVSDDGESFLKVEGE